MDSKIMGHILLAGGAEFGGRMSEPDRRAIELAGGMDAPIRILPTAAALDHNHVRAGNNGVRWFKSLGAKNVEVTYVIDKASAENESIAEELRVARLIYLLGGFPRFTAETLANSRAWQAMLDAFEKGAFLAGSSAGAMVLCEYYFDPQAGKLLKGLNLIPNACVLPHHNHFGKGWAAQLMKQIPAVTLIGINERTGAILEGGKWTMYGAGDVTLYRSSQPKIYKRGESLSLG
jgi:cyanophycinase